MNYTHLVLRPTSFYAGERSTILECSTLLICSGRTLLLLLVVVFVSEMTCRHHLVVVHRLPLNWPRINCCLSWQWVVFVLTSPEAILNQQTLLAHVTCLEIYQFYHLSVVRYTLIRGCQSGPNYKIYENMEACKRL